MSRHGTRRSSILKRRAAGADRLIVFLKKFGLGLAVLVGLFWVGSWLVMTGTAERFRHLALERALSFTADRGFALRNMLVDGRHYTDADLVRAVVGMERGAPILAFNPAQVKIELEKISWIKTAHVERRFPDTIYIRLEERVPFALWQRQQKMVLIDSEGVVLTDSQLSAFQSLPLVVGEGANLKAGEIVSMIAAEPQIQNRVEAATLISGRRWDLRLRSGADIKLPEEDIGLALRKLAVRQEEEALLDKDVLSIDVREEGRITVRTKPGAAQDFNARVTPASAGKPI